ncbi:hypothetical protein AB0L04_26920 [Streptomyces glaucescens]|uniref:hypothetical protein n=1 Tax=Streptomyces glaucescens TaxID=1907 RepID=UPI00344EBF45
MSDEKDPVRVGRFEWERLMLMSVPHPTNFKLLPLGVFMSADGGRVRPGNAGLAQFGPHEKTWAKLLRWAVTEGWLIQVARGGARRGPNGTTIVRASVYAASVPQLVWERRMEILGAPPFRAPGVEGSALDALKGAPGDSPEALKGAPGDSPSDRAPLKGALETPFKSPDPSLKGASRDSLPDPLKGAPDVFEGSDPSFEGSVSGFEGSAQALPHHVVPSRSDSSSTSSTTGAEDSSPVTETVTTATEGGGGGDIDSSEDQEQNRQRAEVFVTGLDYRGKAPDKQQQRKLCALVADALAAGWSERGLDRYLDISDDPNVRNAASLYVYKLNPERLPDAGPAEAVAAGLPPLGPDCSHDPRAASSPVFRTTPLGEPCPGCHPDRVAQTATKLPPACEHCLDFNQGAEFNVRFRTDHLSFQGGPCPRCHPSMVPGDWSWPGKDTADGGMWDRARGRAQARMATGARAASHPAADYVSASVGDLFVPRPGAPLRGTDAKVAGWLAIAGELRAEEGHAKSGPRPMIAPRHQPYRNPTDQAVYAEDFPDAEIVDPSGYDQDL